MVASTHLRHDILKQLVPAFKKPSWLLVRDGFDIKAVDRKVHQQPPRVRVLEQIHHTATKGPAHQLSHDLFGTPEIVQLQSAS